MRLEELGWNDYFAAEWNSVERPGETAARVTSQHRELWEVAGPFGECHAEPSGQLRLSAEKGDDWPAIGDWVSVTGEVKHGMVIRAVLPRRALIERKAPGRRVRAQVLAANVDTIFLLMGLDGDYNPRRMERYLAQLWDSRSRVVVLLNKADLCEDVATRADEVRRIAIGVPLLCVSAATGEGTTELETFLAKGQTVVLLGSSGVGKSSLLNCWLGSGQQLTSPVREHDSRGRHTTTARQLFFVPNGAMVIDTPGLRELQLWEPGAGLTQAFSDVASLAQGCRFRNCTHAGEPGCAVTAAIRDGELEQTRLENQRKLLREQAFLERKLDKGAQAKTKQRMKIIHRAARQLYQQRDKDGK